MTMAKASTNTFLTHVTIAAAAGVLLLLLFVTQSQSLLGSVTKGSPAEIGIEHTESVALDIALAIGADGSGIIELAHDASETAQISVPDDWVLREVRGKALSEILSDPPSFGFTRWHVPAKATLSFRVPQIPSSLSAHNPSSAPLKIKLTKVDLESEKVERNVVLLKEARAKVW